MQYFMNAEHTQRRRYVLYTLLLTALSAWHLGAQREAAEADPSTDETWSRQTFKRQAAPRPRSAPQPETVMLRTEQGHTEVAAGEILLHFGDSGPDRALLARKGLRLLEWQADLGVARVGLPGGWKVSQAAEKLAHSGLPPVWPNAVARAAGWGLALPDYDTPFGDAALDPALVALLDTGVLPEGPAALSAAIFEPGYDFVSEDDLPLDDHQHGTHLASIISRVSGGAARLLPVKVLDHEAKGTELQIARGIDFAVQNGARVVNLSLTFGPGYLPSPTLLAAVERAHVAGVLVVGAAGNSGVASVAMPAALRGVVAVGAIRADGQRAAYSNFGSALDLVAPGGGEDPASDGVSADTFELNDPASLASVRLSGTSMAAAYVSGVAAVVMGADPQLTGAQAGEVLRATAVHYSFWPFNHTTGSGPVNPAAALTAAAAGERPEEVLSVAASTAFIERDGKRRRAVGLVELLDAELTPVSRAIVYGEFTGSATARVSCRTDAYGRCVVRSAWTEDQGPFAALLHIGRAVLPGRVVSRPLAGQRMSASRAQAIANELGEGSALVVMEHPARTLSGTVAVKGDDDDDSDDDDSDDDDDDSNDDDGRLAVAAQGGGSLLGSGSFDRAFQWRPSDLGAAGIELSVVFDEAWHETLSKRVPVHTVAGGLRLASEGVGDPLVWINDVSSDELASGAGLWASGFELPGFDFGYWATGMLYDPETLAQGAGLWASGFTIDSFEPSTLAFFESGLWATASDALGAGLWGSGWGLDLPIFDYGFAAAAQ